MTKAQIIDGKEIAADLRKNIKDIVDGLKLEHGLTPGLAVVLVGEDPASQVYVRNKSRQTTEVGMNSYEHRLDENASQEELLTLISQLNNDGAVHGILVQLPLPEHIDETLVINSVSPEKDVDGFHVINAGRLATGQAALTSCTPVGCVILAKRALGDLTGCDAVVVGRSNIVGKPVAQLLLQENCTVTIAHSRTKNLAQVCSRADIVIAAVGRPQMIKADWIKPGACVIDVGINRVDTDEGKTRLVGDVDFDEVAEIAGSITPVPGGVGPMTIACLLRNTVQAACMIKNIELPEI